MRDLVNEGRELQKRVTSKFAKMVKEAAEEEVSSPIRNLVNKMEKFTDDNQHTKAKMELAKHLKSKKHQLLLQAIDDIHEIEGSLPSEISKYRDSISNELTSLAKKSMNAKEYSAVIGSM